MTLRKDNDMKVYTRPEAEILRTETMEVLCISYGGEGKSGLDPEQNFTYDI